MMTAHSDYTTVEAFENGAWDYIAKPFDLNGAIEKISKALTEQKKNSKVSKSGDEIDLKSGKLIGKSNVMQDLFNSMESFRIRAALFSFMVSRELERSWWQERFMSIRREIIKN